MPLENDSDNNPNTPSDGSDCGHWDENCFTTELMTPDGDPSEASPFSAIAIAGLEDLGYQVNNAAADPFTAANMSPACLAPVCNAAPPAPPTSENTMSSESRASAVACGREKIASIKARSNLISEEQALLTISVLVRDNNGKIRSIMVTA